MKKFIIGIQLCLLSVVVIAQVNLQTGALTYQVPIYSYSDPKTGISVNLALQYVNGNGLKVNSNASAFGTGWDLIGGGSIERTVQGLPDDQKYRGTNIPDANALYDHFSNPGFYPDGYMYNSVDPTNLIPFTGAQLLNYPSGTQVFFKAPLETTFDREMDIFSFNINGRTGQFYIGKNKEVLLVSNAKLKISFEEADLTAQGIRTAINKFFVTDENGYMYTFSEHEVSFPIKYNRVANLGFSNPNANKAYYIGDDYPSNLEPSGKTINKWFLTSVKAPFTERYIYFNYESFLIDIQAGARHLSQQAADGKTSITVFTDRYKYQSKRLTTVQLPNADKIKLNYNYDFPRIDMPGDNAIKRIEYFIGDNGVDKLKSAYDFNMRYFVKDAIQPINAQLTGSNNRFARLCLNTIQFSSGSGIKAPPIEFSYNFGNAANGDRIPARYTMLRDRWGYYSRVMTPNFYEDDDGNFSDWAPFWQQEFTSSWLDPGAASLGCLTKVKTSDGLIQEFEYEQNTAAASPLPNNYAPGVRVKRILFRESNTETKAVEYDYNTSGSGNSVSSGQGYENPINEIAVKTIRQYKNANQFVPYGFLDQLQYYNAMYTKFKSVVSVAISTANWMATGAFQFDLGAVVTVAKMIAYEFEPTYKDFLITNRFYDNVLDKNPLPITYAQVSEKQIVNGQHRGWSTYEFTSFSDYPAQVPQYSFPFSGKQRYMPWTIGKLKSLKQYNSAGTLIKQTNNVYNNISQSNAVLNFASNKWDANTISSIRYTDTYVNIPDPWAITTDVYYPLTGRLELTSSTETEYDKNGLSKTQQTTHVYDNTNFQIKETQFLLGGVLKGGTNFYFNNNFGSSVNQNAHFFAKNIYSKPFLTAQWVFKQGSKQIIGSTANKYTLTNDGSMQVAENFIYDLETPLSSSFLNNINFNNEPYQIPGLVSKSTMYYDNGMLSEVLDKSGRKAFITDVNGALVNATVVNASYNDIAYSSFETNTTEGKWNYDFASIVQGAAKTGKRYFNLSSGSIASNNNLSPQKIYIVNFWAKNASVTVNGNSPTLLKTDADGWSLYKSLATNASQITINGSGSIDELRLQPDKSFMQTEVFEKGVGNTHSIDVNNTIIQKEYDGFGRLALLRDHHKNILKYYCYQFANSANPQPCYGQFFNNQTLSQVFYKSDCYIPSGTGITYTVDVGKHFSFISQEDANTKAWNDLQTNGQALANATGTCGVYARISYENMITIGNTTWADIVVRFFADAAGTQPVSVNNMDINYATSGNCEPNGQSTVGGSGNSFVLYSGAVISYYEYTEYGYSQCSTTFSLNPGTGYIVIN
jgi:hypothetical protein